MMFLSILFCWTTFFSDWARSQKAQSDQVARMPSSVTDLARIKSFTVVVLTMNRSQSLKLLLESLERSFYFGQRLNLEIHIDRNDSGCVHSDTLKVAETFSFSHGTKVVSVSPTAKGLAEAWYGAWIPRSEEDRGIILEDDIILSPHWFWWLCNVWYKYGKLKELSGVTLQRQLLIPTMPGKDQEIISGQKPFMYPLVGSIGFSPNPTVWSEFIRWRTQHMGNFDVSTPGLVTSEWWKSKEDEKHMWTQHFIYFCIQRGLYTLYQHMPDGTTLASHQRERGVHYKQAKGEDFSTTTNQPNLLFPEKLDKFDWGGKKMETHVDGFDAISQSTLISRATGISQRHGFAYLLFTNQAFITLTKNWICNIKSINASILSRVIMVADSYHTVAELSAFEPSIDFFVYNSIYTEDATFGTFLYYRIVLERLLVQNLLVQNYINIMIIESDQVWLSDISETLRTAFADGYQIIAGNERANEIGTESWYICGGFYGMVSTARTRRFFNWYVHLHQNKLMKYRNKLGQINVENDQALLSRLVKKERLRVHWLHACQYTNGMWYTDEEFRNKCSSSTVIHNNYIVGNANKVLRAQQWGQWFAGEGSCTRRQLSSISETVSATGMKFKSVPKNNIINRGLGNEGEWV